MVGREGREGTGIVTGRTEKPGIAGSDVSGIVTVTPIVGREGRLGTVIVTGGTEKREKAQAVTRRP